MEKGFKNQGENSGDRSHRTQSKPLGIEQPFLPHQPLGQKPGGHQFLKPMGRNLFTPLELESMTALGGEENPGESEQPDDSSPGIEELTEIAVAIRDGETLGQRNAIKSQSSPVMAANPSPQLPLTLDLAEISPQFPQLLTPSPELSALTRPSPSPLDLGTASLMPEMPTAWANLEDLLTQTAAIEGEGEVVLTPWGLQRDTPSVPPGDRPPIPPHPPDYSDPRSREVTITAPGYGPQSEPENLEVLARKVYDLIKHRLTLDRERNGGRYSQRSPW
jgi:hypothetical protein